MYLLSLSSFLPSIGGFAIEKGEPVSQKQSILVIPMLFSANVILNTGHPVLFILCILFIMHSLYSCLYIPFIVIIRIVYSFSAFICFFIIPIFMEMGQWSDCPNPVCTFIFSICNSFVLFR